MADDRNFQAARTRMLEARMAHWKHLVGESLAQMLRGKEGAITCLRDPSSVVRQVAIEVIADRWKPFGDPALAKSFEELGLRDSEMPVRHSALLALGLCLEYTDDVRVGALLAGIVRDNAEVDPIRIAAYLALLSIRKGPAAKLAFGQQGIGLGSVDWALVDDSLDTSRAAVPIDHLAPITARLTEDQAAAYRQYADGMEALGRSDFELSVRHFSEALSRSPNAGAAYVGRARAYIALGELDNAIDDLTIVINAKPGSVDALRERARAYRLKGAVDFAERDERAASFGGHTE